MPNKSDLFLKRMFLCLLNILWILSLVKTESVLIVW